MTDPTRSGSKSFDADPSLNITLGVIIKLHVSFHFQTQNYSGLEKATGVA